MPIKFCPKCGSENVIQIAGAQLGLWECQDCGFRGSIFPEKEKEIKNGK